LLVRDQNLAKFPNSSMESKVKDAIPRNYPGSSEGGSNILMIASKVQGFGPGFSETSRNFDNNLSDILLKKTLTRILVASVSRIRTSD
jgi:hypothetical protein